MVGFDRDRDAERIDFRLMRGAPIRSFRDADELDEAVAMLTDLNYHVVNVQASWAITEHMFADLASAFHACCHGNFGCLEEAWVDAVAGTPADAAGFVLVLRGFDAIVAQRWADAQTLLAMISDQAWVSATVGRRVICLIEIGRLPDLPSIPTRAVRPWHREFDKPARGT